MLTSSLLRGICPDPANASNLLKNLPLIISAKFSFLLDKWNFSPLLGLVQLLQVKAKSKSALQLLRGDPAAAFLLPLVMPSAARLCCSSLFQVLSNSLGVFRLQTRYAVGDVLCGLLGDTSF